MAEIVVPDREIDQADYEKMLYGLVASSAPAIREKADLEGHFSSGAQVSIFAPKMTVNSEAEYDDLTENGSRFATKDTDANTGAFEVIPILGILNIIPTQAGGIDLEYRPKYAGGKSVRVTLENNSIKIAGNASTREVYEGLQLLLNPDTGLTRDETSIHVGPTIRNLNCFDLDGNPLNESQKNREIELLPGTKDIP